MCGRSGTPSRYEKAAWRLWPLLAFSLALAALCSCAKDGDARPNARPQGMTGCYYYAPCGPAPEKIPFELYSHVFYSFVHATDDGAIANREAHAVSLKRIKSLAATKGSMVLVSLGGGSFKGFAKLSANDIALDKFAKELASLLAETGCDGLDLDWEFPSDAEEGALFSKTALKLRESVDAEAKALKRPLLLSAAVNGNDWGCRWISQEAALRFDFLNVMAYDMAGFKGGVAAHHSPLFGDPLAPRGSSTAKFMEYWSVGRSFPKEKLAVGLPAYARGFDGCAPYASVDGLPAKAKWEKGWNEVSELLAKRGWTRRFDEASRAPWFFSPDGKSFCCCDDPASIKGKTRWAKSQGYGGVFFWAMNQDLMPDGSFPLSKTAFDAWRSKPESGL